MRAYYFTIIYIIVIFYSHTKSFLSYCHTNACMPQGEIHSSCLQKTRNQHPENTFRFLQKIVSRPPEASKKKSFPV